MNTRPVGPDEAEQLRRLVRKFRLDLGRGRGGQRFIVDLCDLFNCDADALEGRITDAALAGIACDEENLGTVAFLYRGIGFIYVTPALRLQGRGRTLFHALRAGYGSFEMWTKPGDRTAKSFGESVGLKARKLTMSEQQGEDGAEL